MAVERRKAIKSCVQIGLGLALAMGVYVFGTARNQGRIPGWVENLVGLVWFAVVIALIVWQARRSEDTSIGSLVSGRPTLEPGEDLIFKNNFMSAQFFPNEMAFNPEIRFRDWIQGGPIRIGHLLAVKLTNRRLIFGMFLIGRTWRAVPLSMINRVAVVNGRWPYRNALLIEYELEGRAEKVLFWLKSTGGQELKAGLDAICGHERRA